VISGVFDIIFVVFQAQLRASVFIALEEQEKVQVSCRYVLTDYCLTADTISKSVN